MNRKSISVSSLLIVLLTTVASGDEVVDKVVIHGFGSWAFATSDPHPYLAGRGGGDNNFSNVSFSLNVTAQPMERLRLMAEGIWETQSDAEDEESTEVDLDLAFAEWVISDNLNVKFGRSRFPFGIYTDIIEVGTLRPLFYLPQSIYGPTGFVAKSYDGIGVSGSGSSSAGWSWSWDLYGGGAAIEVEEPFEALEEALEDGEIEESLHVVDVQDLLGGRLVISTPVDGLSFGFSAYGAAQQTASQGTIVKDPWGDFSSWGVHVEVDRRPWVFRAEAGFHEEDDFEVDSIYVEGARFLGPRWQVAARVESSDGKFLEDLPAGADSLLVHDEVVLGVNYWFGSNLVVKLALHRVEGNLFAHPTTERMVDQVVSGTLDDTTDLVVLGAQFSF